MTRTVYATAGMVEEVAPIIIIENIQCRSRAAAGDCSGGGRWVGGRREGKKRAFR